MRVPNILLNLSTSLSLAAASTVNTAGDMAAKDGRTLAPSLSTCAMLTMGLMLMGMSWLRHRKTAASGGPASSRKRAWER